VAAARRKARHRDAVPRQHGERPGRERLRMLAGVLQAVSDLDAASGHREADRQLFAKTRQRLDRLRAISVSPLISISTGPLSGA